MSKDVTAIFHDRTSAALAVDRLLEAGFARDDVSLLMSDATRGREFAVEEHSKAPEGASVGAAMGGVLGAIAAGLVAVGTLPALGIGLVAAGPLIAALAGAGAGAAVGGVVGGLVGFGIPEHEAKLYAEQLERGGILVGVKAHEDRVDVAREIFQNTGGDQVHG